MNKINLSRLTVTVTSDKVYTFLLDSSYLYLDIMEPRVESGWHSKSRRLSRWSVLVKEYMVPKKALEMGVELQKKLSSRFVLYRMIERNEQIPALMEGDYVFLEDLIS